jgi:hypothetical protein
MLPFADVTASIPHFVAFEVFDLIEMLIRIGPLTTGWPGSVVAVLGMEVVIYVAMEACGTMKPGASANEEATGKPFWAVVAVRGAVVGRNVIVAVRAFGRDSDVDLYLSLYFGSRKREADGSNSS